MMNSTEFTNRKIEDFEKKLQGLLSNQESKLLDLKIENSKLNMLLENYLDKFNNIGSEFENHKNESKFIKNKVNYLNDFIKFLKYRMDEGELIFEKNKKRKISDQFARNGILGKSIVKGYISGEVSLENIQNPSKRRSISFNNNNDLKNKLKIYKATPQSNSYKVLGKRMTLGPDKINSLLKMEKRFVNKHIDNSMNSDKSNKSNNCISEEKDEDIDYINIYKDNKDENRNIIKKEINNNIINENIKENENENDISSLYEEVDNKNDNNIIKKNDDEKRILLKKEKEIKINKEILLNNTNNDNLNDNNNKEKSNFLISENNIQKKPLNNNDKKVEKIYKNSIYNNIRYEDINNSNFRPISIEKESFYDKSNFPKISNINTYIKNNPSENTLNNQNQQISIFNKLYKNDKNNKYLNLNNTKKYNETSIGFFRDYNNKHLKKPDSVKLKIIEMNFDEANSFINKKDEMKKTINNIKDIEVNASSARNRTFDKNKIYKKLKKNYSDINFDNDSLSKIIINNNIGNNYYYNMMVKDDSLNYSNLDYINYIHKNKIDFKKSRINLKNNK